jgi:hypothetical protein
MDRHTFAGWVHELQAPDAQLTLTEFMALCLVHIRENGREEREAVQHLEGMLGTMDDLMDTTNPDYRALGARRRQLASSPVAVNGRNETP